MSKTKNQPADSQRESTAAERATTEATMAEPSAAERGKKRRGVSAGKKAASRKAKDSATEARKLSALDAAARVLAETGTPMNTMELIQAMAAKGYWASPAGKTPQATLYAAILREIKSKGAASRFHRSDRGKFGLTAKA